MAKALINIVAHTSSPMSSMLKQYHYYGKPTDLASPYFLVVCLSGHR